MLGRAVLDGVHRMAVEDYAQGFWDVIDRVDVAHLAGFDQQGERRSFFGAATSCPTRGASFLVRAMGRIWFSSGSVTSLSRPSGDRPRAREALPVCLSNAP